MKVRNKSNKKVVASWPTLRLPPTPKDTFFEKEKETEA